MNQFKEVCRSSKSSTVQNMEQKDYQGQENDIEMININLVNFNSNCSVIIPNLKASSDSVIITVPYNVYKGSDGKHNAIVHIQKVTA